MAELELLVGNSKRGKPDGVQLLELLQKLVATIPRTDKAVLKQHQRQCEAMLYDVLAHGIGTAVRRLIYNCFSSLYAHGDAISIYTRVNVLQSYLASKEGMSRSTAESIRGGLLDFLAHLHLYYGRMLGNSAPESIGIALRTASKSGNQAAVRCAALRLAAAVVRGLNPVDRSAPAVQTDAWTIVQRYSKDRTCEQVRAGCLKLLGALCAAGGWPLWREGAYGAEEALRLCLTLTEDSTQAVRDAAYSALGELAAASRPAAKSEAVTGEKRPAKKAAAERVVSGCVRGCLVQPLLDAAVHSKRETCLGISRAWMSYVAALRHQHHGNDQTAELLEVASLLINAVNEAGRLAAEARLTPGADPGSELGAGLAGSEQPPLQACALYVLRRGVMTTLAEAGQRKLLERLANSLDKRLCTPAAVVTLEALAALLEAVGEVTDETANSLERLLQPYVTSNSAATRQQAAITMAALAAAHPAAAARMLSGFLATVVSCAAQMGAPLSAAEALAAGAAAATAALPGPSPSASPGGVTAAGGAQLDYPAKVAPMASTLHTTSAPLAGGAGAAAAAPHLAASVPPSPPRPATPNGGIAGGRPMPAQRAVMDTCHGAALSASRLLLTTARAPLGCPARLQRRALALAEDLVGGPGPELAGNRAICREVGFLLLGTLCSLGVPQSTRGPEEMAALWQAALGEAARKELDERGLPQRPGVELELAVQLWWRAVALQALSAYLAAAQAGSGPGAGPAASAPSRSAHALPFLSGAAASFSAKHSEVVGVPRVRSGTSSVGPGAGVAAGWEQEWAELCGPLVPLVEPLLELLDSQSYLHDPTKAKGGPGGILAGAAAMFTLSLLELHLRAPGGRISTSPSHAALLTKTCLRPFRQGLTPAAADSLTISGLRGLLSPDDAPLGPWPPGTVPLEDALRSFTGGRGAPQLPPWLSAEDYTALLSGAVGAAGSGPSATGLGGGPAGAFGASAAAGLSPVDGDGLCGAGADGASEGGAGGAAAVAPGGALGVGGGAAAEGGLVHATYPQSVGLEAALLTVQLVLLGRQTAASPVLQQLQVLEAILAAVQASKTFARQSRDVAACRRLPLALAAAVTALAGYGHAAMAARRYKAPLDPTDKLSEKLLQLAQALMPDEEAAMPAAAALSRATAETYAASAAAGSETWALRVVRALGSELAASAAEGRDSQLRAVLALALGAAHRARGGLAMQAAVASSAEALVAAASRPGCAAAAAWVLHGLWLVACSGGGAFVPRVKTSLQLGQELLVSSFESPALRAACARLANASVAVLGPEFSLGSLEYVRAKSLVAAGGGSGGGGGDGGGQVVVADGGGGGGCSSGGGGSGSSGGGGADGGLGLVLFVQQIVLFAPHAVPPAKHVPLLLAHLLSSQPGLRAAAALTLRHLAERSAEALRPAEAAPLLFAALDRESDARIAGQLRATITTIINASVVSGPSYWLELLSDVVFAAGPPASAGGGGGLDGPGSGGGGDDDDDDKHRRRSSSTSSASGAKPGGRHSSGKAPRSVREVLTAPHLRTRHYAAECLLRLVRVCVASDERHRDSSVLEWQAAGRPVSAGGAAGHGGRPGDLLIVKLQALVDMGFKLATCPLESLRPHGVRMLTLLVQLFGDVPDPLLQGARLMEQYQAQVVSALRSSLGARQAAASGLPGFSNSATPAAAPVNGGGGDAPDTVQHPLLQIAGGVLATCFLESGLAAGDALVMRRLMELLSAPLSAWHTLRYEPYAEWVGARARVELLRAHAQCCAIAAAAATRGDALLAGIVAKAQEPHGVRLQALWALLLQDHGVLCSQPAAVLEVYRSPLLEGSAPPETAAAAGVRMADGGDEVVGGEDGEGEGEGEQQGGGFGLTPAVAAVLRPVYAAACPAALAALAGRLPPAAELAAAAEPAAARAQFRRLLEVGLMLLSDAAARLAHAVQEVARGAATTSHGTPAAAPDFPQLRDAAGRLSGVLRALQRLLSSEYLTALVSAAPAAAAAAPAAAANGKAGGGAVEPLVPPVVLRDLFQSLGAAAAHALLPLHWALAGGAVPPSLGALLSGLALPCCTLLRELCSSAREQSLGTTCGCGDSGDDEWDGDGDGQRRRSTAGGEALAEAPAGLGAGLFGNGAEAADGSPGRPSANGGAAPGACRLRMSDDGRGRRPDRYGTAGATSVAAAAVEAVLLLASVCAPYSYNVHVARSVASSAASDAPTPAAAPPGWLRPPFVGGRFIGEGSGRSGSHSGVAGPAAPEDLPGCVPLPSLSADAATGLAQSAVQVLAAAQQLIRRAPWAALAPHLGPLLELPLRLILTSAPGTSAVAAAQRYLDTTTAALLARPEARPSAGAAQGAAVVTSGAGAPGASPATFAAAAVVALADVTELHLRALRQLGGVGGAGATHGGAAPGCVEDPAAAAVLLQGRLVALVPALLSCAAAFEAAELHAVQPAAAGSAVGPGPSTTPSPSKGALPSLHGRPGSGSGAVSAPHRGARGAALSTAGSSGSGSRLQGPGAAAAHRVSATAGAAAQAVPSSAAAQAPSSAPLSAASVRDCAIATLAGAFQAAVPPAAAVMVLEAARAAVQEAAVEEPGSARGRWARALVCSLMPAAVERVAVLLAQAKQPLAGAEQSLVAECLKLLVLATTLAGPQGAAAQDGVMQVLVPLLVEVAAPAAGPSAVTPALRDLAVKLITTLPAAAAGAAFKTHLAAQPAAAKLRLQGALREAAAAAAAAATAAAAAAAAGGAAAVGAGAAASLGAAAPLSTGVVGGPATGRRPTIQLKTTFALPLPGK